MWPDDTTYVSMGAWFIEASGGYTVWAVEQVVTQVVGVVRVTVGAVVLPPQLGQPVLLQVQSSPGSPS